MWCNEEACDHGAHMVEKGKPLRIWEREMNELYHIEVWKDLFGTIHTTAFIQTDENLVEEWCSCIPQKGQPLRVWEKGK